MATIKYTLDPKNPPKTPQEALDRFDAIREEDIDYSDIPDLSEADFLIPVTKEMISLRVDPDVLEWFRAQGKGYQTKMNTVLRTFYEQQTQKN
ncbi:MAG: BrnA antitoxin family protein [Alphaproteobacteria bacterium]